MLQYFPNITGSLQVTGSVSVSGSITATGGIIVSGSIASASYSSNSELLDNLDSTAFVFTSSFNTYSSSMSTRTTTLENASASLNTASGSFSGRVTTIESKYATTGSNIFTGAQTVCANITSTGTIIAQTLNVQQVTSSIVYSSGSNIFGCLPSNVQQMTGSLRVTGSGNHWFQAGCVGIGTTTPTQRLHISGSGGSLTFGVDQANTSIIRGNATANFDLNNEGGGCIRLYGSEVQFRTSAVDPAVILKNTGETCFACTICMPRAYIANCLLINQTGSLLNVSTKVEMTGTGDTLSSTQASYNVFANHGTNSTWIGYLAFFKSRGTTQGSVTAVASGDRLGMIRFSGADGTEQIRAAEIYSEVDAAVNKCCVPGRIIFATSDSNLNGPVERLRITSTGNVGIGVTNPVDGLDVQMALRVRCNTPGFTNACNSLVIDYVNTSIFGSAPMARYFSIGCTSVGAGHQFIVGTPAVPINALYLKGDGTSCFTGQVFASSGVKFSGGNCVLNNYDEGSWTIVATGSSSGSGNVGTGTYTRVGRLVTATFLINNQTFPSYSGTLRLSLPFAVGAGIGGNLSFNTGGVYFYPYSAWGAGVSNFTYLQAVALNSTSYVTFAISCVNGDLQTTITNTNSSTSGAAGLYLRFTITYEV